MQVYNAKCKKCKYEVEVYEGPVIQQETKMFTGKATFICPECKGVRKVEVMANKKMQKSIIDNRFRFNEKDEEIIKAYRKALDVAVSRVWCPKCKRNMLKFSIQLIDKKICPICGDEIDLELTMLAD